MTNVEFKVRKPRIKLPSGEFDHVKGIIKNYGLTTVCAESHCPNMSECWSKGTATFMVMGDTCTRGCRFCNVKTGAKGLTLDPDEPRKLVQALKEMKTFDYVVLTSVDRDDLPDEGSGHFAECIREIKKSNPNMLVEVLIPDFKGNIDLLKTVVEAGPDVIAHNVETIERLQGKVRDIRANYKQSLSVLENVKKLNPNIITKSAIMLGLGETKEEVIQTMKDLRKIDVEILTIGQYLQPSQRHLRVVSCPSDEEYKSYEKIGEDLGYSFVVSGINVRSSYKAAESYVKSRKSYTQVNVVIKQDA